MDFEENFTEYVYLNLCGFLTEPHPDVENLFAEGKKCEKLYKKVYDAYQLICERLEIAECTEVENIINAMTDIQKEIAVKMYEYGVKFNQK